MTTRPREQYLSCFELAELRQCQPKAANIKTASVRACDIEHAHFEQRWGTLGEKKLSRPPRLAAFLSLSCSFLGSRPAGSTALADTAGAPALDAGDPPP